MRSGNSKTFLKQPQSTISNNESYKNTTLLKITDVQSATHHMALHQTGTYLSVWLVNFA